MADELRISEYTWDPALVKNEAPFKEGVTRGRIVVSEGGKVVAQSGPLTVLADDEGHAVFVHDEDDS